MKAPVYASLSDFWLEKKQEFINGCTLCGDCMEVCPVVGYTDYPIMPRTSPPRLGIAYHMPLLMVCIDAKAMTAG